MHLISINGIDGTPTEAKMVHKDKELRFNISLFDRMSYSGQFDIFEQINRYWSYVSEDTQDKVFDVYNRIRFTYDNVWDQKDLTLALHKLVGELYSYHELADIHHWVWFNSDVALPHSLHDEFTESNDLPRTRERTYLKDDYKWLVSLSISLRLMIPVWGEFISRTKRNNTALKEYFAFQLLNYTNLINSEPMERLRIYVEHTLPIDKAKSSAIFGGISTIEFPIWVLGLVTVRRLSIGDVRGIDQTSSLVTFIFKYIGQKVKSHDNSFIGIVKDKINEGQAVEGENNLSTLEYKIKQEIPAGDIAIIDYYINDVITLATNICSDIDLNILADVIKANEVLATKQIWKPQVILTQWVLAKTLPPKGLLHINKLQVIKALSVAQALLWHRGHHELAILISATEQTNKDELSVGSTDSRARITKDQLEILDKYYPYSRKPVGKQKIMKNINPAVEAIDSVANMFSQREWIITAPEYMVNKINNGMSSIYSTPYNIKILLAKLVISLAKREF